LEYQKEINHLICGFFGKGSSQMIADPCHREIADGHSTKYKIQKETNFLNCETFANIRLPS
jgi:hypothetical protein